MKKILKGIISFILLSQIIFFMIPFNIHADSQIVPTYSSSAQTWVNTNGYVYVTNYCEGTSAATNSCKLTFTLNSNWYGMIYIDGYDSSNTQWINYQPVFIADGHGEYNYNFWQSGQKVISKVTVLSINLVKPNTTVDLSQIIALLTSIENDTSSIDLTLDNTLSQITNVLNQLIISNGYFEDLLKIRNYNVSLSSFVWLRYLFSQNYVPLENTAMSSYNYPLYRIVNGNSLFYSIDLGRDTNQKLWLFFSTTSYITQNTLNDYIDVSKMNIEHFSLVTSNKPFLIYRICLTGNYSANGSSLYPLVAKGTLDNFIPFSIGVTYSNDVNQIFNFDDELALFLNVNNRNLSYLYQIAYGNSQSNQSASDLQQSTDSMQDQMDDMVDIESGYNQQFNNSLNDIDFTNPIQSNAGILPAANFVITVFNGLVNNPLSILIIIICILTIGKKVIGK